MMKYLIGLVAGAALVIGYFVLAPSQNTPPQTPVAAEQPAAEPAPSEPLETVEIAPQVPASTTLDEEALLENMAADTREGLPATVTETLTMTDALFLPRMRIMEFNYVAATANAREMKALIEARAETICLQERELVEMDVTLRSSFEDQSGNLFQRVYLLPEDCQRFY